MGPRAPPSTVASTVEAVKSLRESITRGSLKDAVQVVQSLNMNGAAASTAVNQAMKAASFEHAVPPNGLVPFIQRLKGPAEDKTVFCNRAINLMVQRRRKELVDSVLKVMDSQGIPRDTGTYNALMRYHIQKGMFRDARSLHKELIRSKHAPDETTLLLALASTSRKNAHEVEQILRKTCRAGNFKPSAEACETFLEHVLNCQRHTLAVFVRHFYEQGVETDATHNMLLSLYVRHNRLPAAIKLLHSLRRRGKGPTQPQLKTFMRFWAYSQKERENLGVLRKLMQDFDPVIDREAVEILTSAFRRTTNPAEAEWIFRLFCGPGTPAYSIQAHLELSSAYERAGSHEDAVRVRADLPEASSASGADKDGASRAADAGVDNVATTAETVEPTSATAREEHPGPALVTPPSGLDS